MDTDSGLGLVTQGGDAPAGAELIDLSKATVQASPYPIDAPAGGS